jgi:hypothetical protein
MSEPSNNNEEVVQQLLAEIRTAKGHELVQLTGMYNKLTDPKKVKSKTGTAVDDLPEEEKQIHQIVMRAEKIARDTNQNLSDGETRTHLAAQARAELIAEGVIPGEDVVEK